MCPIQFGNLITFNRLELSSHVEEKTDKKCFKLCYVIIKTLITIVILSVLHVDVDVFGENY